MPLIHSTFEAQVTHLSQQGFGVIKGPDRATYFARNTWRGDRGRFRCTDECEGAYRFAELVSLLEPSPERQPAPCPHLGPGDQQCFGCPWMMVNYPAQLKEKQHRVQYALDRIGLRDLAIEPILASALQFQYRRRAQFKTDGRILGYSGRLGLSIAPIENCLVLTPPLQEHLQQLRSQLPHPEWQPGAAYIWNYLDVDEHSDRLKVPINRRRPFQQANAVQNEVMRTWIHQQLQAYDRSETVLELFSGSGNFTEVLVELGFSRILAVEAGGEAIAQLQAQAWPGVSVHRMDLYKDKASRDLARLGAKAGILLMNPPRAGIRQHWRLGSLLAELQCILLISCDPVSFASDARRLIQQGFHLTTVQPLDQLPHTPHVEVLAKFERTL